MIQKFKFTFKLGSLFNFAFSFAGCKWPKVLKKHVLFEIIFSQKYSQVVFLRFLLAKSIDNCFWRILLAKNTSTSRGQVCDECM